MPKIYGNAGTIPQTRGVPVPTRPIVHTETPSRAVFVSPIALAPEPAPVTEAPAAKAPKAPRAKAGRPRTYDHADIVARYKAGQTRLQIREETGCAYDTTAKILAAAGVPMRDERTGTRKHDYAEISRLYVQEQMTIPAIAKQLHMSKDSVRTVLLTAGVELRDDRKRNGGQARTLDWGDIIARYEAGASFPEIAAALSANQDSIRKLLRRLGDEGKVELREEDVANYREVAADRQAAEIAETIANGASLNRAALIHGVSTGTIKRAIARYNETARPFAHRDAS